MSSLPKPYLAAVSILQQSDQGRVLDSIAADSAPLRKLSRCMSSAASWEWLLSLACSALRYVDVFEQNLCVIQWLQPSGYKSGVLPKTHAAIGRFVASLYDQDTGVDAKEISAVRVGSETCMMKWGCKP